MKQERALFNEWWSSPMDVKTITSNKHDMCELAWQAARAPLLEEIERLNARVAMMREALEFECGDRCNAEYNPCNARRVIDSTEADVTKFINDVKADALEEAANKISFKLTENDETFEWNLNDMEKQLRGEK